MPDNAISISSRGALSGNIAAASQNTAIINALALALKGSDFGLYIPMGNWYYNAPLVFDSLTVFGEPNVSNLIGNDGTATPAVGVTLTGASPSLANVNIKIQGATVRGSQLSHHGLLNRFATGGVVSDVVVSGAAAAGFFCSHSSQCVRQRCKVVGSLADGFHHTGGSSFITNEDCAVDGAGDDYFSVVSYQADLVPTTDIVFRRIRARGQTGGRGCAVVGGQRITFNQAYITQCWTRGLYVAAEGNSNNTFGVDTVLFDDVHVVGTGGQGPPYASGADGAWIGTFISPQTVQNIVCKRVLIEDQVGALVTVSGNTSSVDTAGIIGGHLAL